VTIPRPFSHRSPRRPSHLLIAPAIALAWGCGDTLDELEGGDGATFTSIYESLESDDLCSGCHAPNAPGDTEGTEATQDWSTRDNAFRTLRGTASGLIGNFEGCNGVPLLGSSANQSLLVASLDEDVRADFSNSQFPDCTADSISDQTVKIGGRLPSGVVQDLKAWIDAGRPDN
jgi:hypothetical protein